LISFSFKLVSDLSSIGSGEATVRRKLLRNSLLHFAHPNAA